MRRNLGLLFFFGLLSLTICFLAGCGPNINTQTVYQKEARYRQDFVSPVALFIRERNGEPFIIASAFIVDKERGLFASAKHFVGNESDGNCKIFFNGRVYSGFLVKVPAITDVAVIKIEGNFNPKDFPEPYKFAKEVRKGDKVFIRGIHPHAKEFQQDKKVLPIFGEYYGLIGEKDEFVFDDLPAKVVDLSKKINSRDIKDSSETLADISSNYILLKADEDHKFSFSGLSGGPTLSENNELVGINALEIEAYFSFEQRELVYHPWTSLNLVPASELEKLMQQLADIK